MGFYYVATYQWMFVNAEHNVYIFVCFFDFYPSIHCYFVLHLGVYLLTCTYTHIVLIYDYFYYICWVVEKCKYFQQGILKIVMILKKSLAAK